MDAFAGRGTRAAQVERIVDAPANPAMIGAGFYGVAKQFRSSGNDFEVRQNVGGQKIPGFERVDGRSEWSSGQDRILAMVGMAGDRGSDQHRGVEVGFHGTEAFLICSSRMASAAESQFGS